MLAVTLKAEFLLSGPKHSADLVHESRESEIVEIEQPFIFVL